MPARQRERGRKADPHLIKVYWKPFLRDLYIWDIDKGTLQLVVPT